MSGFAVVTGGSTGIGRHLVSAFAEAGYTVAFSYLGDEDTAETLMEEIELSGGQALGVACDVGVGSDVDAFFDEVCSWYGDAPDVLVNNAGIQTGAVAGAFGRRLGRCHSHQYEGLLSQHTGCSPAHGRGRQRRCDHQYRLGLQQARFSQPRFLYGIKRRYRAVYQSLCC